MGNGCSSLFKVNKICYDDATNIIVEIKEDNNVEKKESNNSKKVLNDKINFLKQKNQIKNENDIKNISSLSANNPNPYLFDKNRNQIQLNNNNNKPQNNEAKLSKNENMKSENRNSFTNLVQELDFSFVPNKATEQFEIFDMNYIEVKKDYNEKMMEVINKIRNEPQSIIEDLNLLLNKNNQENKILVENDETHENIVFNDIIQDINETIKFLEKTKPINIKFNLNEELSIDIKSQKYSELPLEKKITKIIVDKKRDIIKSFPKVQFFINFVKDAKIGVLYLLMKNSKMSNFRNVIFDDKYKEFNVSWMRDKNNIFISFLCFS
jgi:hypothetical protein